MRKSLSHLAILVIGLCFWVAAAVGYFEKDEPTEAPRTAEAIRIRQTIFWSLVGGGAFFVVLHHSALVRFERWRKRLPFALEGTDVLGLGEAVTQAELAIEFSDTKADEKMVAELVRARLSEHSSVVVRGPRYALVESDLDRQGSNHPLGQWLRAAVNEVLRDVHAAYPIRKVTLTALKTDEFYIPSGD